VFGKTKQVMASLLGATVLMLPSIGFSQAAQHATGGDLPAYLLVVGKASDRTKIGSYAGALPPIYASNRAHYLAIGGAGRGVTWLEGPWRDRSIILGKFPSRSQIDSFWWGDAYRAAIRKRDNAGVFSVVALDGIAPLSFEGPDTGFLIVMTAPRNSNASQVALSQRAAISLKEGVQRSGGQMMTSVDLGRFTSMEGDSVFDRFIVAAWPTLAARDAYLASSQGRQAARLRRGLGLSAVAIANGVARTQAPPEAKP
jgi:uncharacterized protein (DUF1330 family)